MKYFIQKPKKMFNCESYFFSFSVFHASIILWKHPDNIMKPFLTTALTIILLINGSDIKSQVFDRPPAADELNYTPEDHEIVATNPPAFLWLPLEGIDNYILQYSSSDSFDPGKTVTVKNLDITVHIPLDVIKPGVWYWRYGFTDNGEERFSRIRQFTIPEEAAIFPFVVADDIIKKIPKQRPRLHFSPELINKLRNDKEGNFKHITGPVIKDAEKILAMNEPLFEEPKPWNETDDPRMAYVNAWRSMRPYTQRMITNALAYLYTGDKRFALEARRRLMHFMEWDINGPSTTVGPDELGMDIIENAAPVFDWIYPELNEADRKKCLEVLSARVHQISYDVHRSRPMETRPFASHQGRMIGFVVEAGIVLAHDVPEVSDWMNYTLKLLWSMYPAWGGKDGGWHEGVSYWRGYMGRMFRVVAEMDRLGVPLKNKPFFKNTGYYGLYAAYPKRPTKAFGDIHEFPVGVEHGELMYILSSLYSNPYFLWHAEVSGAEHPSGRDAFLYQPPAISSRTPDDIPQSRLFNDIGLVVMHSNMKDPDNNVTMLFQSDPFGAISHNFACQNAFVIEAWGEPLAISTGSRQLYGSPHHSQWMWHTKAHNSILVDNEGQVIRNRNSSGKIIDYSDKQDYVYAAGDATPAYGGRLEKFHRYVIFIRPNHFIVIDDLKTTGEKSTFQWLLHSPTEILADCKKNVMINRSGNAALTARFLEPDVFKFSQHTGFSPQVEDSTIWHNQFHLTASTLEPSVSKLFVTVMAVELTTGQPVKIPSPPSTPRREITISNINNSSILNEAVLAAKLVKAQGGIAIRFGNDLILWRERYSLKVEAEGVVTARNVEVFKDHYKTTDY